LCAWSLTGLSTMIVVYVSCLLNCIPFISFYVQSHSRILLCLCFFILGLRFIPSMLALSHAYSYPALLLCQDSFNKVITMSCQLMRSHKGSSSWVRRSALGDLRRQNVAQQYHDQTPTPIQDISQDDDEVHTDWDEHTNDVLTSIVYWVQNLDHTQGCQNQYLFTIELYEVWNFYLEKLC